MKIPKEIFEQLKQDILFVVESYKLKSGWKDLDHGKSGLKVMWQIYWKVTNQRQYDDSHPKWETEKRIFSFDKDYRDKYKEFNDSHIDTALRKIKQEIEK